MSAKDYWVSCLNSLILGITLGGLITLSVAGEQTITPMDTSGKWVCWIDKDSTDPRHCMRTWKSECNTCTEYDGGGTICTAMACSSLLPHAPDNCQPKPGETKVCDK